MGAAIWSAAPGSCAFPARFFVALPANHGMFSVDERPQWRRCAAARARYVDARRRSAIASRLATPVRVGPPRQRPGCRAARAARRPSGSTRSFWPATAIRRSRCSRTRAPPSARCSARFRTAQRRRAAHRRAPAAALPPRLGGWNYHRRRRRRGAVARHLRHEYAAGPDAPVAFCVTLNARGASTRRAMLSRFRYDHPVFTPRRVAAQARHANRTARGARTTAAPTGATASTRTASSARSTLRRGISTSERAHAERLYAAGLATPLRAGRARIRATGSFMLYLDLAELTTVFRGRWLWSTRGRALAWSAAPTTWAIRASRSTRPCANSSRRETGARPDRPDPLAHTSALLRLRLQSRELLLLLRRRGRAVETIVAEITNTPWGERHCLRAATAARHAGDAPALPARQGLPRLAVHADGPRVRLAFTAPGGARACTCEPARRQ